VNQIRSWPCNYASPCDADCALGVRTSGATRSAGGALSSWHLAPGHALHMRLRVLKWTLPAVVGLKPAMRTAVGEAAGAHDQCCANAVGNAVLASQANAPDAGAQSPADAAGSSSAAAAGRVGSTGAAGSASGAASGSGYSSSGMFAGNSSNSGSTGAGGNGSSVSNAPSSSMPWTYDYMLFILPRQYTGWSYTEVRPCSNPQP
jgi:hypothetical protein